MRVVKYLIIVFLVLFGIGAVFNNSEDSTDNSELTTIYDEAYVGTVRGAKKYLLFDYDSNSGAFVFMATISDAEGKKKRYAIRFTFSGSPEEGLNLDYCSETGRYSRYQGDMNTIFGYRSDGIRDEYDCYKAKDVKTVVKELRRYSFTDSTGCK